MNEQINKSFAKKILSVLESLGIYFISLVMISFATPKFFNTQFQLFLHSGYMPFKEISSYTLAWSFLGYSYKYNLFLGIAEFTAGSLVLFKRTRLIGLLLALALYTNIVIIDLEFQVVEAIVHAIIELVILILLLLPYTKDLKTFFWDHGGKMIKEIPNLPSKKWKAYFPYAFLTVLILVLLAEGIYNINNKDKIMGEYNINQCIVNKDTLDFKGGKYTKQPMLFFEFANTCIFSVNEKSLWADYYTTPDSIKIKFDKDLAGIKTIHGKLDREGGKIIGTTDNGLPIYLQFSKPLPKPQK